MYEDAKILIREQYDNRNGINELQVLLAKSRTSRKKILDLTDFEKKIKLKELPNSWRFTRPFSMVFKLIETLFYVIISNTHNFIYLCCIFSMYENAGLIGLVYPLSIFGYALLEETRPRKEFWAFLQKYTVGLLTLKFFLNLTIFGDVLGSENFKLINGYVKFGVYDYEDYGDVFVYMLPEILMMGLIILNEIHLRLIGLYYVTEQDVETIEDGIQRNILKGDDKAVRQ